VFQVDRAGAVESVRERVSRVDSVLAATDIGWFLSAVSRCGSIKASTETMFHIARRGLEEIDERRRVFAVARRS